MHYRLDLISFDRRFEAAYRHVNQRMAARLKGLLGEDDTVWIHDYHYLLMGHELRVAGFAGPIGFFLHIPFPPPEIFAALPNANSIVRAMMDYDVIGFQTGRDCLNFDRYITDELGGEQVGDDTVRLGERETVTRAFPIGIDAEGFERLARSADAVALRKKLHSMLEGRNQVRRRRPPRLFEGHPGALPRLRGTPAALSGKPRKGHAAADRAAVARRTRDLPGPAPRARGTRRPYQRLLRHAGLDPDPHHDARLHAQGAGRASAGRAASASSRRCATE